MSCTITFEGRVYKEEDFLVYLSSILRTNPMTLSATNHSGGAYGGDTMWDQTGVKPSFTKIIKDTPLPLKTNIVKYTPIGKQTQTYTIEGNKILNSKGVEVFSEDNKDRRKIFANYAVQQGRAVVVTVEGVDYVVNNKGNIISVATGNIVFEDLTNGLGKRIREEATKLLGGKHSSKQKIKPGVEELFETNTKLANEVYGALGFGQLKEPKVNDIVTLEFYFEKEDKIVPVKVKITELEKFYQGASTIKDNQGNIIKQEKGTLEYFLTLEKLDGGKKYEVSVGEDGHINQFVGGTGKTRVGTNNYIPEFDLSKSQITPQQKQQAQQLYSEYLDTIFPQSKVKDILYNGSSDGNVENNPDFKPNNNTIKDWKLGRAFSTSKKVASQYGKEVKSVIIDANNIEELYTESGDVKTDFDAAMFADKAETKSIKPLINKLEDLPLGEHTLLPNKKIGFVEVSNEAGKIYITKDGNTKIVEKGQDILIEAYNKKITYENELAIKHNEDFKNIDTFRTSNLYDGATEIATTYQVRDNKKIYELGSKQDIEGFKNWVDNFQKVSSNSSQQVQQDFNTPTDIDSFAEEAFKCK